MESSAEGMETVTHGGSWQDSGVGTMLHILPGVFVGSGSSSHQSLVVPAVPSAL